MKYPFFVSIALCGAALFASTHFALAAENMAQAPQSAASKAKAKANSKSKVNAGQSKSDLAAKLVDINSAPKDELKKLPGIGDAEADKIVAGRPYGTKGWLVSHKILPEEIYPAIRELIVAKQPYNDAVKNAANYGPKK